MSEQRWAPLLTLDPDLGLLLPDERREEAARDLTVNLRRFDAPTGLERTAPSHLGLLVVDGVLARDVAVPGSVATELLGAGDLIRPWTMEEPVEILETEVRWSPLTEVTVALLDRRAAHELCGYPEIYAALMDRLSQRAARLATTQAIAQMTRVDRRLLALFRLLAERWGRMSSDGVQVPLRLSHRLLGQLVGARRPTISAALGDLARTGELVRRDDSIWLIRQPVPARTSRGRTPWSGSSRARCCRPSRRSWRWASSSACAMRACSCRLATADRFTATVEEIVGRKVYSFTSALDPDKAIAYEIFLFEPARG